jgi:hypothetical protein
VGCAPRPVWVGGWQSLRILLLSLTTVLLSVVLRLGRKSASMSANNWAPKTEKHEHCIALFGKRPNLLKEDQG